MEMEMEMEIDPVNVKELEKETEEWSVVPTLNAAQCLSYLFPEKEIAKPLTNKRPRHATD